MGLDTTHNAWHGPYSAFGRFREAVAEAAGIPLQEMDGFGGDLSWDRYAEDPISALLDHSDCEGDIDVRALLPLADRLEALAPQIEVGFWSSRWREAARQFAKGCRAAAAAGEPVGFH